MLSLRVTLPTRRTTNHLSLRLSPMAESTRNKKIEEALANQLTTLAESNAQAKSEIAQLTAATNQLQENDVQTSAQLTELTNTVNTIAAQLSQLLQAPSPSQNSQFPSGFSPPNLEQHAPRVNDQSTTTHNDHHPPLHNRAPHFLTPHQPPNQRITQMSPPIPRTFKLKLPRFDGRDPKGWFFKANQFLTSIKHPSSSGYK